MKKYLLCILVLLSGFLLVGCGKYGEKDIVNDLNKKISKIGVSKRPSHSLNK